MKPFVRKVRPVDLGEHGIRHLRDLFGDDDTALSGHADARKWTSQMTGEMMLVASMCEADGTPEVDVSDAEALEGARREIPRQVMLKLGAEFGKTIGVDLDDLAGNSQTTTQNDSGTD